MSKGENPSLKLLAGWRHEKCTRKPREVDQGVNQKSQELWNWLFADQNLIRRWADEYYPNAWTKTTKRTNSYEHINKNNQKHRNYPWRGCVFFKTWVTFSSQKTGDAAAQVASKCCKLQQLHYGLNLWWSLDGSLRSFCDKQSGDAAADIGATLSCAAGGYGEPWRFAKRQIKGTTNMPGFGTPKWTHLFLCGPFFGLCVAFWQEKELYLFCKAWPRDAEMLHFFLLTLFFGSLAFQKNPS